MDFLLPNISHIHILFFFEAIKKKKKMKEEETIIFIDFKFLIYIPLVFPLFPRKYELFGKNFQDEINSIFITR